MTDSQNSQEPYEFQEKKSKKARTRTWLILGAGGLLGVVFIATTAFGLRGAEHELLKREGELHLIVPDGERGLFGFKPFDRDHNREHFEGEEHGEGSGSSEHDEHHEGGEHSEPNFDEGVTD
jgi:hypothetical protein